MNKNNNEKNNLFFEKTQNKNKINKKSSNFNQNKERKCVFSKKLKQTYIPIISSLLAIFIASITIIILTNKPKINVKR